MSNDVAFPVLRTPDPALALATARQLMRLGRDKHSDVSLYAELRSVAEARRLAEALPEGWFRLQELGLDEFDGVPLEEQPPLIVGVQGPDLPVDEAPYEGRMPVEFEQFDLPIGSVEDAFTEAVGAGRSPGEINWRNLVWPDGEATHAEVTLLLNTRTRELDEPSDDHTVLLHVRSVLLSDGGQAQEPYAHWLASQVGLAVIGPGQRT